MRRARVESSWLACGVRRGKRLDTRDLALSRARACANRSTHTFPFPVRLHHLVLRPMRKFGARAGAGGAQIRAGENAINHLVLFRRGGGAGLVDDLAHAAVAARAAVAVAVPEQD